jgi:hypothetical protein
MDIQGERRLIAGWRPAHDPASLEALVRSLEALRRRREPNHVVRAP